MQKRHTDREQYFHEQAYTIRTHVISYIRRFRPVTGNLRVLEVGCGEGGNLLPFAQLGCACTGVDLDAGKLELGRRLFAEAAPAGAVTLLAGDVRELTPEEVGRFDLVLLKDTIEHIPDQCRFLGALKPLVAPGGALFFAFPPWGMPFGGHQQICRSRLASVLPFYHLLPASWYAALLRRFGESEAMVKGLLETKETGIWIEQFRRYVRKNGYRVEDAICYFINPNYEVKFNLHPRRLRLLDRLPGVRNFFTTAYYCLLTVRDEA